MHLAFPATKPQLLSAREPPVNAMRWLRDTVARTKDFLGSKNYPHQKYKEVSSCDLDDTHDESDSGSSIEDFSKAPASPNRPLIDWPWLFAYIFVFGLHLSSWFILSEIIWKKWKISAFFYQ